MLAAHSVAGVGAPGFDSTENRAMRAAQAVTEIARWRWMPFVALSAGALFLNLLIVLIVPSRIEASKASPAPKIVTGTTMPEDDDEPNPFAATATAPRAVGPGARQGLGGSPFSPPPMNPPPPMNAPPPAPPPEQPPPPPPPMTEIRPVTPPPAPPPEPPPPVAEPPGAQQQRILAAPMRGMQAPPPPAEEAEEEEEAPAEGNPPPPPQ
jgi:hypothetical protein